MSDDFLDFADMMADFPYEGLVYSLQKGLTFAKIKADDYDRSLDTSSLASRMSSNGVNVAIQGDDVYFPGFLRVKSSPYMYYYKGNHDLLHKPLLAIVGPRKMTPYAREVLEELFAHLKRYDVATISGMAEGVDQLCHELSITNNVPTIAVLGAGVGHLSKSHRRAMMDSITDSGGLVLSEFPLGFKATHYSYPQRNRLVAGLAKAVFLPEAREKSGSLITVDFANVMGVPVYGACGQGESSRGLSLEMQKGRVRPIVDYELWLDEVFGQVRSVSEKPVHNALELDGIQKVIYERLLAHGEQSVDVLAQEVAIDTATLLSELTMMEIEGVVRQGEGGRWRVC